MGILTPIRGSGYKKNEILVGTSYPARLFKSKYQSYGYLISNPIKITGERGPIKIKAYKIKAYPPGSYTIKFRTFKNSDLSDTVPFDSVPPFYQDSFGLEDYPYITVGDSFIQYKIELFTSNPEFSPWIDCVKIYYEEDTVGPVALSATAQDGEYQQDGKDPDDYVLFIFDEPTSKIIIDENNVDSLFMLSNGHSWLNSYGDFGGAVWSDNGETLKIYLAFSGNQYPSVEVGDTVYVTMQDQFGFWNVSTTIITGTFDDIIGPVLKSARATDGSLYDDGVNANDTLYLIFSEPTNTPSITPSNIDSFFYFKGQSFFGDSFYTTWEAPESLIIIFTGSDSKIYTNDTIVLTGYKIKDGKGNPAEGERFIEGTFDKKNPVCDSIVAYDNTNPDTSIDYDDFVAFYFSEDVKPVSEINKININTVFKLSNNHSWLSGGGEIGNILIYNKYIFVFLSTEGGAPTVSPGDTVYFLPDFILDYYGNPLRDTNIITGSFTKIKEFTFNQKTRLFPFVKRNKIILKSNKKLNKIFNRVLLYDLTGRKLFEKIVNSESKNMVIPFDYKKGVYFLILKNKNNNERKYKIIKVF